MRALSRCSVYENDFPIGFFFVLNADRAQCYALLVEPTVFVYQLIIDGPMVESPEVVASIKNTLISSLVLIGKYAIIIEGIY